MKQMLVLVLLTAFLVACGSSPAPTPVPPTAVPPTSAPAVQPTAAPPTAVPATVAATAKPAPTNTAPAAQPTAAPATAAPKATEAPKATVAPTTAAAAIPADWVVRQTDHYSIALPPNYSVSSTNPFTAIDAATFQTISVIAGPTISGKIQTIIDTAIKTLTPGSKVIKSQAGITINGKEAGVLEYDMAFGTGSATTHSIIVNYYILSGSDEFDVSISGGKPDDASFIQTAELIGNSLRVK